MKPFSLQVAPSSNRRSTSPSSVAVAKEAGRTSRSALSFLVEAGKLPRCLRRSLALFLAALMLGPPAAMAAPPHIVLILADDLGWADLPSYGNTFHETPHLDQFAREGMRFTEFYAAAPVCSPTRASLFSGQYPARLGMTDFVPGHWRPYERLIVPPIRAALPLEILTPAETLREAGYRTAYFGKWHLGGGDHHPSRQGFDEAVVTSGRHIAPAIRTSPPRRIPEGTLLTEWLTDQGIDFMRRQTGKPCFLTLAHYAVHIPLEAPEALVEKYRRKPAPRFGVNHPVYAAMIEALDRSVGRFMAFLEKEGIDDQTVVLFTSDNGGLYKTFTGRGPAVTDNLPLRDEKGSLYEGGIRVPMLVRWPGQVPGGTVCRVPAMSIDLLPTFRALAGVRTPWQEQVLDGVSLWPLLQDPCASLPREALFFHYPHYHHSEPAGAIRSGDWKLLEFFAENRVELYNLRWDIGETRDWSMDRPELTGRLRGRLQRWREATGARMPLANPDHDPARAAEWWSRRTKKPLSPARR